MAKGASGYLKNKKKTKRELDEASRGGKKNMTPVNPKTGKVIRKKK